MCPTPPAPAWIKHRLAGLEAHPVDERFPRRDQDQRHGGGFDHRQLRRLARRIVFADDRVLGVVARTRPRPLLKKYTSSPGLKRRTPGPHRLHRPGAVATEHRRQVLRVEHVELAHLGVERVEAGRAQPHQQIVRSRCRCRYVGRLKHLGAARRGHQHCFHDFSWPASPCRRMAAPAAARRGTGAHWPLIGAKRFASRRMNRPKPACESLRRGQSKRLASRRMGHPKPACESLRPGQFLPVADRTFRTASNSPCMNAAASFAGTYESGEAIDALRNSAYSLSA